MKNKPGLKNSSVPKGKGKKTFFRLFKYLMNYKWTLVFAIFFAIISTSFIVLGPFILGNITTIISEGAMKIANKTGGMDYTKILATSIFLGAIYLIAQIFSYLHSFLMTKIAQNTVYSLRKDVNRKLARLPLKYFDTHTHGEILSKITSDIEMINTSLQQSMTQFITSVITIVGILSIMFFINIWMTLITLLVVPLSFFMSIGLVKKSQHFFINQQKFLGEINSHVEEMYSGHNIIKIFNQEANSINKFKKINDELYSSFWKAQFISNIMMPVVVFAGNIGYVLLATVGSLFVISGALTIGNVQAFIQYIRNFNMPIGQISQIISILQSTMAASQRVFELLDQEEEVKENDLIKDVSDLKGDVEFTNVCFGYNKDKPLIDNCNISVKSGQKIAIVGPTGAGKTTLINLLMRFYDVDSGSIKVDGIDIRDMSRDKLRSIYGMVLQDTWLFSASIRDNIRYGMLGASDDQVYEASKLAYADHFIKTLPKGYDMVLNEETNNISGGQKQLLTIARAILSDPKILILDEATSSIDTRTEALIQKAMTNLMKGRTSFVIAHRLSTIKDADLILVMKDGNVIETGTHDELMINSVFYSNLYNSQFKK